MSRRNRPAKLVSLPQNSKQTRLQDWVLQEGWQVGAVQFSGDAQWAFTATNQAGHVLVIAQPKPYPDQIFIQATINFDDSVRTQLEKVNQQKRKRLFWDIRLELLRVGVEFEGVSEPLKAIVVTQRIYDDGLNKDTFAQRTYQVKSALLTIGWMLGRELDHSPPDLKSAIGFTGSIN